MYLFSSLKGLLALGLSVTGFIARVSAESDSHSSLISCTTITEITATVTLIVNGSSTSTIGPVHSTPPALTLGKSAPNSESSQVASTLSTPKPYTFTVLFQSTPSGSTFKTKASSQRDVSTKGSSVSDGTSFSIATPSPGFSSAITSPSASRTTSSSRHSCKSQKDCAFIICGKDTEIPYCIEPRSGLAYCSCVDEGPISISLSTTQSPGTESPPSPTSMNKLESEWGILMSELFTSTSGI